MNRVSSDQMIGNANRLKMWPYLGPEKLERLADIVLQIEQERVEDMPNDGHGSMLNDELRDRIGEWLNDVV